jgi:hypothetical protein
MNFNDLDEHPELQRITLRMYDLICPEEEWRATNF